MFEFLKQQQIEPGFDYKRSKKKIEQKSEVAKNLQGFRWGGKLELMDGGYTSGGLTNPLSTIATIAANVAGAKLLANSQKEQDELDKAGEQLYRDGMKALQNVRENPTDEAKTAAKTATMGRGEMGVSPLTPQQMERGYNPDLVGPQEGPYEGPVETPMVEQKVAQPSPVAAPAIVEAKPLEPAKKVGRALPRASTGSGRGVQGGPTAAELAAKDASKIDAQNLQSPMQVFPDGVGNAVRSPWMAGRTTAGEPIYDNMGREDIGVSPLTPQQIERIAASEVGAGGGRGGQGGRSFDQTKEYVPPESVLPAATAAKQAATAGGGRGGQGGPSTADLESVRLQVARQAEAEHEAQQIDERQLEAARQAKLEQEEEARLQAEEEQQRAKVLRKTYQSRLDSARDMLQRSGDRGQKVVDTMDAAYVQQLVAPEDDKKNYIAVGDRLFNARTRQFVNDGKPQVFKEGDYVMGDGGLVRVGGRSGPKIKETKDTPAGILAIYEDGSTKILDKNSNAAKEATQAEADKALGSEKKREIANGISTMVREVIASGDVELAGAGMMNSASGFLNKTLGVNTKTAEARSRIDALKARMVEYVLNKFADSGMSPNKLADTKRELELHVASMGNFDWERLGPDALKVELEKVGRQMAYVATNNPYKAAGIGSDTPAPVNTPRAPSGRAWER